MGWSVEWNSETETIRPMDLQSRMGPSFNTNTNNIYVYIIYAYNIISYHIQYVHIDMKPWCQLQIVLGSFQDCSDTFGCLCQHDSSWGCTVKGFWVSCSDHLKAVDQQSCYNMLNLLLNGWIGCCIILGWCPRKDNSKISAVKSTVLSPPLASLPLEKIWTDCGQLVVRVEPVNLFEWFSTN